MKTFMLVLLLSICSFGQNWFPYNPINTGTVPSVQNQLTVRINQDGTRNLDFGIIFYNGNCVGEFWAYVDFNLFINYQLSPIQTLYTSYIDFDIFNEVQVSPFIEPSGPIYSYWAAPPQVLTSFITPNIPQANGSAFSVNLVFPITIARIASISYPPSLYGLHVTLKYNLLGNMNNAIDGSGWFVLTSIEFPIL